MDGYGAGAYLQAGWFVTGQRRRYEPHWGIFGPLQLPKNDYAIELVSRFSYTRAEDDINDWNAYSSLTLGGNLYYRRFRGSLNILYGKARDAVDDQDDGLGMVARLQFLF